MPNPTLVAAFPSWIAQCAASFRNPSSRMGKTPRLGQAWAFGLVGYTMGNVLLGPNPKYPNCNSHPAGTIQWPSMLGLASNHPGGANVLMCYGSVRFLKDSTNMQTIWALGSRAGGEIISSDSY